MNRKIYRIAAPLLAAVLIAGCGGGGGGGGGFPPVGTAPPGASDPYDTFMAYVKGLVESMLDTAEPADVAAYDPAPTSDTKEPVATQ
ncbi:MAG: hypothetical protein WKG52_13645 [Variovorax sp.]